MSNRSPAVQYQTLVSSNKIHFDDSQQQAIELLQQLYVTLQADNTPKAKLLNTKKTKAVKGVYLWGKVGRGKTFLMDLLVNSLPSAICRRQHFHHFMQEVHSQLKAVSGTLEPLKHLAKTFSAQYRVLCFDEFFVSDIGDAMLLGNLLQYMFAQNVVVVCTSNCAPELLYRNGLQRERFLPAIAAIEQHTSVLQLAGEHDHRQRSLTHAQIYFELPKSQAQQKALHSKLLHQFNLTPVNKDNEHLPCRTNNSITILGRAINIIAQAQGGEHCAICVDFSQLCQGPRSHFDYIALAKQFNTLLVFNVPPMSGQTYERIKARGTEDNGSNINVSAGVTGEREVMLAPMDDAVRRFIALVDECYDSHIHLLLTAFVPQATLYTSGALMFEFERTKSRLTEMASKEYQEKTQKNQQDAVIHVQ